jgi:hypothetical protein
MGLYLHFTNRLNVASLSTVITYTNFAYDNLKQVDLGLTKTNRIHG